MVVVTKYIAIVFCFSLVLNLECLCLWQKTGGVDALYHIGVYLVLCYLSLVLVFSCRAMPCFDFFMSYLVLVFVKCDLLSCLREEFLVPT
jgi:hypothetical protein